MGEKPGDEGGLGEGSSKGLAGAGDDKAGDGESKAAGRSEEDGDAREGRGSGLEAPPGKHQRRKMVGPPSHDDTEECCVLWPQQNEHEPAVV
ncbi:hypothetical protein J6590_087111 [Homalodisca vitripennis]|nr:hypothetical protein J6590_087111 [Homalodisca vitripennis]